MLQILIRKTGNIFNINSTIIVWKDTEVANQSANDKQPYKNNPRVIRMD